MRDLHKKTLICKCDVELLVICRCDIHQQGVKSFLAGLAGLLYWLVSRMLPTQEIQCTHLIWLIIASYVGLSVGLVAQHCFMRFKYC